MTSDELWRQVGAQLREVRLRKGYETPAEFYARFREPAAGTIATIEAGHAATLSPVETYCRVLGVSLPVVLRRALGDGPALDADALRIAEAYQVSRNTELRGALWALAMVLEQEPRLPPPSPSPSPAAPLDGQGAGRDSSGSARIGRAPRRRGQKRT